MQQKAVLFLKIDEKRSFDVWSVLSVEVASMWWLGLLNCHQLPTAELRYDQSLSHSVDQHNHEGQGKGLQGKG